MQGTKPQLPTLLLVDSDRVFLRCLQRVMERRGYDVTACDALRHARTRVAQVEFDYALIEVRLSDGTGLDLLEELSNASVTTRAAILTAYGDIPTAVAATKLGAIDYMAKPSNVDEIDAVLHGRLSPLDANETFVRPEIQELRYLLAMYERHGRNMSETARAASMHRRTLQRILRRNGIAPSEQIPPEERIEVPHLRRMIRVWTALLETPGTSEIVAKTLNSGPMRMEPPVKEHAQQSHPRARTAERSEKTPEPMAVS